MIDKARTMLVDSGLPKHFWAEAIDTAVYLANCTPSKSSGKTPMELWNGKQPKLGHLRVFGAVGFYHVEKEKREKFDPKGKPCILVGYSRRRVAYRVYDLNEKIIREVRSVKFLENIMWKDWKKTRKELNCKELEEVDGSEFLECEETEEISEISRKPISIEVSDFFEKNEESEVIDLTKEDENDSAINAGEETNPTPRRKRGRPPKKRSEQIQEAKVADDRSKQDPKFIPRTYKEAMETPYREEWKKAMEDEMNSLRNEHNVWELVERQEGKKVIKNKWVYTIKENPDGSIKRRKARLVAVGNNQKEGIDYELAYAPVMKMESMRMLIDIAARHGYSIRQYDVKTAYLHGELEENEQVLMEQPQGFEEMGGMVCKLTKSLYGLPQAGRCWNKKMNEVLMKIGMTRLKGDPCIYYYDEDGQRVIIGAYVDDLLSIGNDELLDKIIAKIREYFILTENGNKYLGIEIARTSEGYEIHQRSYIRKTLENFGLEDCKPVRTPGDINQKLVDFQGSKMVEKGIYQEMIGKLTYVARGTRPDIAFQVSNLAQYQQDPREIHLTAVKRVYRYLKGTLDYTLKFTKEEEGKLKGCSDASWCTTKDKKSITGYLIRIQKNIIGWRSKKQNMVTMSTCESELVAMAETVKEIKWTRNVLSELGEEKVIELPTTIEMDSAAGIDWLRKGDVSARTKHFERNLFYVREEVEKGNMAVEYINGKVIQADVLTKNLPIERLKEIVKSLRLKK